MIRPQSIVLVAVLVSSPWWSAVRGEDPASPQAAEGDAAKEPAKEGEEGEDKGILSKLTIALGADVVDERSFTIRDDAPGGKKKIIRLGNVKSHEEGSEAYEEKVEKGTNALKQFAEKQMVFWRAAPEEHQTKEMGGPKNDWPVVIADVWTIDGRHLQTNLVKAGHLVDANTYESEFGKDILMADADEQKKGSYKKLEEALKENDAEKKKAAAEAAAEEDDEPPEDLGFAGWIGLGMLGILVLGAVTNFGRDDGKGKKKKGGFFASLFRKLKGS